MPPRIGSGYVGSRLGQLIVDRLNELNVTQESASIGLGVNKGTLSTWQSGSRPRPIYLPRLAEWLGISVEEVIRAMEEGRAPLMFQRGDK
jgi:transcriptional regulator with XRE-family HTH domain